MKNLSTKIKSLAPAAGILLLVVADVALAQQGGNRLSTHLDGHASEEVSAGFRFFILLMAFVGVLLIGVCALMTYYLLNEKGPQQIQQIGWKGPIGAFVVGGFLVSLPWLVDTGAGTATGTDGGDGWQRLQQGAVEYDAPIYANAAPVLFVIDQGEQA
ncbi:hypothetical protein [Marinimicrobium sp. ABcell2]|uniref:hypothetical protein n=1 Tax=Marinimicrobium sp. ABcell2 TaxID=3069751 RepID=UPI0027B41B28|nr:hypothetical protein [Marinimicrobium sp. ABcell2]MDQ2077395.1 hypothetical protein [Marinimicrobium sp. ABcell2]